MFNYSTIFSMAHLDPPSLIWTFHWCCLYEYTPSPPCDFKTSLSLSLSLFFYFNFSPTIGDKHTLLPITSLEKGQDFYFILLKKIFYLFFKINKTNSISNINKIDFAWNLDQWLAEICPFPFEKVQGILLHVL